MICSSPSSAPYMFKRLQILEKKFSTSDFVSYSMIIDGTDVPALVVITRKALVVVRGGRAVAGARVTVDSVVPRAGDVLVTIRGITGTLAIDRFHLPGHTREMCKNEMNPDKKK
ncbi:unnamed protein product [Didymodactylos carnosus]|uniref:Uncharacterized protein n=1 Tax=Didymodactylos carnosus TaxID=1234261 RepID=A0A815JDQ7_9BILA|nr:unnamed protein product [Didymodactylos carnosus]CAF4265351.1 unnamed protein product [Didymodactylos carnosus]